MHPLAFIATGMYGHELPKQNGAPIRLVVPWKYGFKRIKSIVKIEFVEQRPIGLWEKINAPPNTDFMPTSIPTSIIHAGLKPRSEFLMENSFQQKFRL